MVSRNARGRAEPLERFRGAREGPQARFRWALRALPWTRTAPRGAGSYSGPIAAGERHGRPPERELSDSSRSAVRGGEPYEPGDPTVPMEPAVLLDPPTPPHA